MKKQEFVEKIEALAIELNARVEIEYKGLEISQAVFYVGRRIAFFVTLNEYFDEVVLMDAKGEEHKLTDKEFEKTITLFYFTAVSSLLANVSEVLRDVMK